MALKIRLARGGSKKRPYYQIVVADARSPRDGRFLEKVGSWNPMLAKDNPQRIELKADLIKEWIAKGAQPTDRVLRFLAEAGLADRAARSNPEKALPGKRALERVAEKKQKAEDASCCRSRSFCCRIICNRILENGWRGFPCRPFFVYFGINKL